MEYEIEAGKAGDPCGGVPPSPSPSNSSIENTNFENNCPNVESHEATGDDTSSNEASNDSSMETTRAKYNKGLIIAYLNINSIRNKFEFLKPLIADNIDVLAIAETKIDEPLQPVSF